MQSRKELAEAGRRKLEEFRKAKAQGKAQTKAHISNPTQDASGAPAPTCSGAPTQLPWANGTSNGYLGPAPVPFAPSPPPPPPQVSPGPPPTALPSTSNPPKPNLATATTFVVLQDVPIPFGAPAVGSAAPAPPPTSASGFPRISSNGSLLQPWTSSINTTRTAAAQLPPPPPPVPAAPAAVAPFDAKSGSGQGPGQQPGGDASTAVASTESLPASTWPWESPLSAYQQQKPLAAFIGPEAGSEVPTGAAAGAVGLSDGVAFFRASHTSPEPPQSRSSALFPAAAYGAAMPTAAAAATPAAATGALSSIPFFDPPDTASRHSSLVTGTPTFTSTSTALPTALTNGWDQPLGPPVFTHPKQPNTSSAQFDAVSSSTSGNVARADFPGYHSTAAGVPAAASSSGLQGSVTESEPGGSSTRAATDAGPPWLVAGLGSSKAQATDWAAAGAQSSLYGSGGFASGKLETNSEAAEPGAASPAPMPLTVSGANETYSTSEGGLRAKAGPAPLYSDMEGDLWKAAPIPFGGAAATSSLADTDVTASVTSASGADATLAKVPSVISAYDELSDRYLAASKGAEAAGGSLGARRSDIVSAQTSLASPPARQLRLPFHIPQEEPPQPDRATADTASSTLNPHTTTLATAQAASDSLSPALHALAPFGYETADTAAVIGPVPDSSELLQLLRPPSSSVAFPVSQQAQQQRAANATSRFTSWLFGTPSPAKQQAGQDPSALSAPSTVSSERFGPQPPPLQYEQEPPPPQEQEGNILPSAPAPAPTWNQPRPQSFAVPHSPKQVVALPSSSALTAVAPFVSTTDSLFTTAVHDTTRDMAPPNSSSTLGVSRPSSSLFPFPFPPQTALEPHLRARGAVDATSPPGGTVGAEFTTANGYDGFVKASDSDGQVGGTRSQPVPSFLPGGLDSVAMAGATAVTACDQASDRNGPLAAPSSCLSGSKLPLHGSLSFSHDTTPSVEHDAGGSSTKAPSFRTSFVPPLPPPGGAGSSTSLPGLVPKPLPMSYLDSAASTITTSTSPAAVTSAAAATSSNTPHFTAAATYLSAYASSTSAPATTPAGTLTAAAVTSTSTYLESYLDNLLSTMSTAARDGSHDSAAHTADHTHDGSRLESSYGESPPDRSNTTPQQSSNWDISTGGGISTGSGGGGGRGDGRLGHDAAGASGRGTGVFEGGSGGLSGQLEGAGSSGRVQTSAHAAMDGSERRRSQPGGRVSTDDSAAGVSSMHLTFTGGGTYGGSAGTLGAGGGSGVSRAQFSALQQHIDELTEEKMALARGLQQQTRINEQLAEENEQMMRQYNARGAAVDELQRKLKQYEQELDAQAVSLKGFSDERQAARSSYAEASSRAQALAAEVVGLEAQVLQFKSAVLKSERAAEEAQQRARKLQKQVDALTREAAERAGELQQTQLKGRNLVVKLKQTETKLQAAEEKLLQQQQQATLAGSVAGLGPSGYRLNPPNGHEPLHSVPSPPPKITAEQEVQCDLAAELAAEAAANVAMDEANKSAATTVNETISHVATAMVRSMSRSAVNPDNVTDDGRLAADGNPLDEVEEERWVRVDWEAARPHRDAPSAVVAERALASLDEGALRTVARGTDAGALPEGLAEVALQLARWLPAGPVSGSDPVAVMVEEELRLLQSIHELLGNFEEAQETTANRVAKLQARVADLGHENEDLRQKLELQTQRLELQMQQGLTIPGLPVSLHQTPVLTQDALNVQDSGPHIYQPAQPFLPSPNAPEPESSVVTPTRSTRVSPPPALDSFKSSAVTATKQTWMGYIFRGRHKKRTRSAIL